MSQVDLLDPRASNRFLRAYAFLASEYAAGAKSAIESLLPFIKRGVEASAGSVFDARKISAYVEETYRVRAPIYMMDAFKHKLLESGHLKKPPNAPNILMCECVPADLDLNSTPGSLPTVGLEFFEQALTDFAERDGLNGPYASGNWSEALIKFFAGWDDKKPATIARQLIYDSKRLDDRVVSRFIASLDKKGDLYQTAKKLYYGVIVADFFTCISEISSSDSLQSVAVVLDTTLLMRLLGTSGDLLREATEELVRDIQQLGGVAYYFSHTYEELVESLEALAYQAENRLEMNRESAHALAAGETSLAKIKMYAREADVRLGELSITQHSIAYSKGDNRYQIDEDGFVQAIGGRKVGNHRVRWERDAKSLALIVRVRKNNRTRRLGDCAAIFVTHNGAIARTAREFLEFSSFDVPPILTTDQISVLSWLERGGGIDDQELSAKLAAACYEAVIPREGWEAQFWQKMEELKQTDEYRDLLNSQVLTNSMRSTILDRTFGEPSLARQIELGPILKELAENAERESAEHRLRGIEEGGRRTVDDVDRRLQERSRTFASYLTSFIFAAILASIIIIYLFPAINSIRSPGGAGFLFILNAGFALCLSVLTILTLFGITPTLQKPREAFRMSVERAVLRFMRWLALPGSVKS